MPCRRRSNASSRQFRSEALFEAVSEALRASNLAPNLLEIELTESLLVENVEHAMGVMGKLKAIGTAISIDDFGTGYSSLSYLHRFPIDVLKIDQSLVRGVSNSAEDAAITSATIAMARQLGLRVVAEGVEEQGQMDVMRDFATPLPLLVIAQMLGMPHQDRQFLRALSEQLIFIGRSEPDRMQTTATAIRGLV